MVYLFQKMASSFSWMYPRRIAIFELYIMYWYSFGTECFLNLPVPSTWAYTANIYSSRKWTVLLLFWRMHTLHSVQELMLLPEPSSVLGVILTDPSTNVGMQSGIPENASIASILTGEGRILELKKPDIRKGMIERAISLMLIWIESLQR